MRVVPALVAIVFVAGAAIFLLRPRMAQAEMLRVGDVAPDFSADAILGEQTISVRLSDYRGRPIVLYFYPKDSTPGCTKEACAFRDGYAELQNHGIILFGCSIDSARSHRAFAKKYGLPFPLLLDPEKKIARAYGAENGIPIIGLNRRITYVIGEDGRILKAYQEVDPATHAVTIIRELGADKKEAIPAATVTPPPPSMPETGANRPAAPGSGRDSETE
jgi:thioredoxin-dependent peroxiredoxin